LHIQIVMTSVFEVLSNKETRTEDNLLKATDQKHQSAIETNKENEPLRKYFMICQTCFWCASYIDIMGETDVLPGCALHAIIPQLNYCHYRTMNIIILNIQQPAELFWNLDEKSHLLFSRKLELQRPIHILLHIAMMLTTMITD
jgi:hypothetical protein